MADIQGRSTAQRADKSGQERGSHERPPRSRGRVVVAAILLAVGIGLVLYPLVGNLLYRMSAESAIEAYDASVADMSQDELDALWEEARAYNRELGTPEVRDPWSGDRDAPPLDRYWDVLDPDGTGVMGYVEAPAAGIMVPIYHGVSDEVLEEGAGHIETTALPVGGSGTHAVVTAHTGLPDKMLFTNLHLLRKGDVFTVHVLGRELNYRVTSIDIIEPDDTSRLQPVAGEELMTLFTCTPYGVNSHRLLVTGVPTEAAATASPVPWWGMPLACGLSAFLILAVIVALWMRRRAKKRLEEDTRRMEDARCRADAQGEKEASGEKSVRNERDTPREKSARHEEGVSLDKGVRHEEGVLRETDVRHEGDMSDENAAAVLARDKRAVRLWTLAVVATGALFLVSLWVTVGVAMRVGLLPYFDLGYAWVDANLLPLYWM